MAPCATTLMSAQPCQVRGSPDTPAPPTESVPIQTEVTRAHACQDSLVMVLPVEVGACNTRMHYNRMRTTRSLPYPRGLPGQRPPDREPLERDPLTETPGQRPLEGIWDQVADQQVTSYRDPLWTDRRL